MARPSTWRPQWRQDGKTRVHLIMQASRFHTPKEINKTAGNKQTWPLLVNTVLIGEKKLFLKIQRCPSYYRSSMGRGGGAYFLLWKTSLGLCKNTACSEVIQKGESAIRWAFCALSKPSFRLPRYKVPEQRQERPFSSNPGMAAPGSWWNSGAWTEKPGVGETQPRAQMRMGPLWKIRQGSSTLLLLLGADPKWPKRIQTHKVFSVRVLMGRLWRYIIRSN